MTTHYIDIRVLPDPEFAESMLMGALYTKLHRALVQRAAGDIGVSFPHYSRIPRAIGPVLRLHGSAAALDALMGSNWLAGMRDHVRLSPMQAAPADAKHCTVQRRQFKTSAERLRRRRIKRKGETADQAAAAIPDDIERKPDLPFVHIRSSSTGQSFQLFVKVSAPTSQAVGGTFNTYGLSATATVPWF
ncbi:CRISPR-associated protein Csy4 [Lampropedia cohaerens]|uniref:CRISPR-associated protein Csy4 n=1 Tax=Lampropedia cohaerens TaxID=1610491 RepID=A0A0U1Q222_9BURK|nr:type I-F CRISPR-associated endoribonuclease Cas6/Csy4 [Lampropedia cohaerens]KKW68807.1 CRISPR-associated protein Csy4 [Lampropedia cohaerens]